MSHEDEKTDNESNRTRGTKADAARMKSLRKRRDLSQAELAQMAKVGIRTVSRAEKGEPVDLQSLVALAAALEVSMEAIAPTESDFDSLDPSPVLLKVAEEELTPDVGSEEPDIKVVRLSRVESAGELLKVIKRYHFDIDVAIEMSLDQTNTIANLVDNLDELERRNVSRGEMIRVLGGLQSQLASLRDEEAVDLYFGPFFRRELSRGAPLEQKRYQLVFDKVGKRSIPWKVSVGMSDEDWERAQRRAPPGLGDFDDDIPF